VGKASRVKAERRQAPVPPVGKKQPLWNRTRVIAAAVAAVVIVGAVVGGVAFSGGGSPAAANVAQAQGSLAGLQTGEAPWSANAAELPARLKTLGLPALTQEGTVLHTHQHLDLYVNGKKQPVPMGIGIDPAQQFIATIHTHDPTGIIHVESPTQGTFTLGQFFGTWGVRLTPTRVGSYGGYKLYVNGKRYTGNPTELALRDHQELALVVGKAPAKIPAGYSFPAGD
jgi:hypothetical protein